MDVLLIVVMLEFFAVTWGLMLLLDRL